jgi:hypothetical protein
MQFSSLLGCFFFDDKSAATPVTVAAAAVPAFTTCVQRFPTIQVIAAAKLNNDFSAFPLTGLKACACSSTQSAGFS